MTRQLFSLGLVGGLLLFVLILIIGTLVIHRKGIPGWTMVVSTVFLLLGIAGLAAVILGEQWDVFVLSIDDDVLWDFTFICLTVASALFTTGFVWERLGRR